MLHVPAIDKIRSSGLTLLLGGLAAWIGYHLNAPLFPLLGPAVVLSVLAVAGMKLSIAAPIRDLAFVILGISVGSGINPEAIQSVLTWPLAFVLLGIMLLSCILASASLLVKFYAFDKRSAVLATSPGHLSFVLAIGIAQNCDVTRITVIQSLRLLLLTLGVPLIASLAGIQTQGALLPAGTIMPFSAFAIVFILSVLAAFVMRKFNTPAAFFLGGMLVSSISHASDLTPGTLSAWLLIPGFIVLGSLIGSRFSGITVSQLLTVMVAGMGTTTIAVLFACLFAVPAAEVLGMPWFHVLFAFAPGGLETMIILGMFFGANPGFLAAAHVTRLLILSFAVPVILAWVTPRDKAV